MTWPDEGVMCVWWSVEGEGSGGGEGGRGEGSELVETVLPLCCL